MLLNRCSLPFHMGLDIADMEPWDRRTVPWVCALPALMVERRDNEHGVDNNGTGWVDGQNGRRTAGTA